MHESQLLAATERLVLAISQLTRRLSRSQDRIAVARYNSMALVSDQVVVVVLILTTHRLKRVNRSARKLMLVVAACVTLRRHLVQVRLVVELLRGHVALALDRVQVARNFLALLVGAGDYLPLLVEHVLAPLLFGEGLA